MKKTIVLLYGVINYMLGASALVALILFTFNLFIPFTIDSGTEGNVFIALAVNIGLITLFGVQHSVMARGKFKQWLSRHIPEAAERSTFMLATAIVSYALCILWQPMPQVLWQADNNTLYNTLLAIGLGGWALVFYATFLINHFDLFGLRQVWLYFRGKEYTHLPFKLSSLYKYVRHPIMSGVFIGIWVTPVMTVGHLVLALGMSAYIVIGVYHEERDLIRVFGDRYLSYMKSTAKFFPQIIKGKESNNQPLSAEL